MINNNNFQRLTLAKRLNTYTSGKHSNTSEQWNQRLVDCMMDDYSDINFDDLALRGLLDLLDVDDCKIENMKVWDLFTLMSSVHNSESFCGRVFEKGFSKIFEASKIPNGLNTLNQMLRYIGLAELDVSTDSDPQIDEDEKSKYGGDVYSISIEFDIEDSSEMDSDYAFNTISASNVFLTTDFNNLFNKGQVAVDEVISVYLNKAKNSNRNNYTLTRITIWRGESSVLNIHPDLYVPRDREINFNMLSRLPDFEVDTEDNEFIKEIKTASSTGSISHIIKGKLLESAMGL